MRMEEIEGALEIEDDLVDEWYECLTYEQRQNVYDFMKDEGRIYAIIVEEGDDLEEIEDLFADDFEENFGVGSGVIGNDDTLPVPDNYKAGQVTSFFRNNEPKAPLNVRYNRVESHVWQTPIKEMFSGDYECESFLEEIWKQSTETLGGLEVSVIVDRDNNLFLNHGSPGFVDYEGVNLRGMRLPLRCWIHTHPFGYAFWSGTDNRTLRNWRPALHSAIVLGKGEHLKWEKTSEGERMTKVVNSPQFEL